MVGKQKSSFSLAWRRTGGGRSDHPAETRDQTASVMKLESNALRSDDASRNQELRLRQGANGLALPAVTSLVVRSHFGGRFIRAVLDQP
jgi:hypothetical protein